jgi:hypothetical protein
MSNNNFCKFFDLLENDLIKDRILSYLFDKEENKLLYDTFNYYFDKNRSLLKNCKWMIYNSLKDKFDNTEKVNKFKYYTNEHKMFHELETIISDDFMFRGSCEKVRMNEHGNNYVLKLLEKDIDISNFTSNILWNSNKILFIKDNVVNYISDKEYTMIDSYECTTIFTTCIDKHVYYVYINIDLGNYRYDRTWYDFADVNCYKFEFIISDDLLKLLNHEYKYNYDYGCNICDSLYKDNSVYSIDSYDFDYYNSEYNDTIDDDCISSDKSIDIDIYEYKVFIVIYDLIKNGKI